MNEFKPLALDDDNLWPVELAEPQLVSGKRPKGKVTTETLTSSTCRWPIGDPTAPDFHYCGERPQPSGVYCDTHDAMSRPAGQRRR